jgi:hypothetical protein
VVLFVLQALEATLLPSVEDSGDSKNGSGATYNAEEDEVD